MHSSHHTSRSPRYAYNSDSETDNGYQRRPVSSSRTREYRDRDGYDRKSSRHSGSRLRAPSTVKQPELDDADAWDTDYDPKDKYYLSAEDDPYNLYGPERKTTQYEDRHRDLDLADHDRKHSSPRRSHHYSDRHESADRRKSSSAAKPQTSSSATASSRPRPRTHRAGSSYTTPARPRTLRAGSSYTARPRMNRGVSSVKTSKSRRPGTTRAVSHGGAGKSVRTKPRPISQIPWGTAATSALEAGAVAAIKASHGPGGLSQKGAKVVTAALGAALVDTFLSKKMPKKKGGIRHAAMREATEAALGNFVVGPIAAGGGGRRRR